MNIKQQRRISNLTRILSRQDSSVIFTVSSAYGKLFLWADNASGRWYDELRTFHAEIGVRGGMKVLSKRGFYL
jgi:hypothetical protein